MKLKEALFLLPLVALASCSGSGGGGTAANPNAVITSVDSQFIDAPVEGLNYSSTSHSGVTGSGGSFTCVLGEEVTFKLGSNMTIGTASCGKRIMLENLDTKAYKSTIGAALQSFGVVSGKITIPAAVRSATMPALTLATANDAQISTFVSSINTAHSLSLTAVTKANALTHVQQSEETYKISDADVIEALKELAWFTSADNNTQDPDSARYNVNEDLHIVKNAGTDCAVDFQIALYRTYVVVGSALARDRFYVLAYTTDPQNAGQIINLNGTNGEEITSDVFSTQFNVTTDSVYKGAMSLYLDIANKKVKGQMKYTVDGQACSATINEAVAAH